MEVSAKDGTNIEETFMKLAQQVKKQILHDSVVKTSEITLKSRSSKVKKDENCNC